MQDDESRPDTEWQDNSRNYKSFLNTEEMDEENIHIGVLCTRIVAIAMLVSVIILFAIGAIYNTDLFIAAGIVCGIMILIFVLSFYEFNCCKFLKASYIFRYNSRNRNNDRTTFAGVTNQSQQSVLSLVVANNSQIISPIHKK